MADPSEKLRWSVYAILIALSVGHMTGRILAINALEQVGLENDRVKKAVEARKEKSKAEGKELDATQLARIELEVRAKLRMQRPFLSANDRSRWATVRALVELGTYEIDEIIKEPGWDTIDMVQHRGWDGKLHLYSSKPPLFATLMAGPYWLIHTISGATLGTHPHEIGRGLIILFNVFPLVVYWLVMGRLIERIGTTDWGRILMMAGATFGTFLTTFAVSVNNHLLAAVCTAILVEIAVRIWYEGCRAGWAFVVAGLFGALLFTFEFPALSLVALVACGLMWRSWRQFLLFTVPAAALVMGAALGTNYWALGTISPAYAHRSETDPQDNWYKFHFAVNGKEHDSYWTNPKGIDLGEPSVGKYAFHTTLGHHGLFSLTPLWLLSLAGTGLLIARPAWRALGLSIAAVSLACFVFYLFPPLAIDRNYGGVSSGLRWTFWLIPLWLTAGLPAADALSTSRLGRGFTMVLLALSALSVAYPWQPWKHPWIADFLIYLGWVQW